MKPVLVELKRRIGIHNVAVTAAGIAFYGMLTLIPLLTALVATYALVSDDPSQIQDQVGEVAGSLDDDTRQLIGDLITSIVESMQGSATPVIIGSILVALFSASGTVQKLLGAINLAYETQETRPGWMVRIMSFGFTSAAIVLMVVLTSLVSAIPLLLDRLELGSAAELAIGLARLPLALLVFMFGVTVLYRFGPRRSQPTRWLNTGSLVAGGLFVLFGLGLNFYTSNVGALPASYGLLGSIGVLMLFLQLTALAVIVGAEVNAATERHAEQQAPSRAEPGSAERVRSSASQAPERLSSGQALAGLVALFVFGQGRNRG